MIQTNRATIRGVENKIKNISLVLTALAVIATRLLPRLLSRVQRRHMTSLQLRPYQPDVVVAVAAIGAVRIQHSLPIASLMGRAYVVTIIWVVKRSAANGLGRLGFNALSRVTFRLLFHSSIESQRAPVWGPIKSL